MLEPLMYAYLHVSVIACAVCVVSCMYYKLYVIVYMYYDVIDGLLIHSLLYRNWPPSGNKKRKQWQLPCTW